MFSYTCRMAIDLVPLGTLTMTMGDSDLLPHSPLNTRVIVEFTDIRWEGERLRGTRKGPAGDWLSVGPDDTATLDFRFAIKTHDGALVYVQGNGRTDAKTFASGGECWFTPRFETGDPRYAWLNKVQAVAKGSAARKVVTFEVFELR
jgi:hypothetical protein